MQKNTLRTLTSNKDAAMSASTKPAKTGSKKEKGPSKQTIENILNFSKALKVEPTADQQGFIEYIAN